jgi:hypothetical protein
LSYSYYSLPFFFSLSADIILAVKEEHGKATHHGKSLTDEIMGATKRRRKAGKPGAF